MIPTRLRALFVSVASRAACGAMATPTLDASMRDRAETLVRHGQHYRAAPAPAGHGNVRQTAGPALLLLIRQTWRKTQDFFM